MPNTVTITLPQSHVVTSRGVNVEVDLVALSPEIIAKLALHGLTQKAGDSAASAMTDAGFKGLRFDDLSDDDKAKVQGFARSAMEGTVAALVAGEWSERQPGESVDPVVNRVRVLFGALLREQAKDAWAVVKGLDPRDRGAKLDEMFAGQDDDFRSGLVAAAKKALAAEAKAKAETAKMTIKVNL